MLVATRMSDLILESNLQNMRLTAVKRELAGI